MSLPIIAILRGIRPDEAVAIGQALLDAGADTVLSWPVAYGRLERELAGPAPAVVGPTAPAGGRARTAARAWGA